MCSVAAKSEEELVSRLVGADRPVDVTRAAGAWLGARLADDGFVWAASQQKLERRTDRRRELIFLQNSKWNRTGVQVLFNVVLNVRDGALADWRLANPTLTLTSMGNADWLCGHPLVTLCGRVEDDLVDLSIAQLRLDQLHSFVRKIHGVIIPWFATTSDPQTLVDAVPAVTLDLHAGDLAEWLVSRDATAQAALLFRRWLALSIKPQRRAIFEQGVHFGERGQRPGIVHQNTWAGAGWTAGALGVAAEI